jgi:hypothetical protein
MWQDPIVKETRELREEYAQRGKAHYRQRGKAHYRRAQ